MVTPLTFARGDDELIDALRSGHPGAPRRFYDRYAASVQRTLQSVLGRDAEIPDLLQDVFIRAIDRIGELEHLDQVRSWLTTIAVFAARAHIRRQTRRKWLFLFSPDQTQAAPPGAAVVGRALRAARDLQDIGHVARERAHRVRAALHRWADVAGGGAAAGTSLATFKRRLSRAEKRFLERVRKRPLLEQWLQEGTRWTLEKQS